MRVSPGIKSKPSSSCGCVQRRGVVVRAAEKSGEAAPAKTWTPPQLDPSTPSPIFGGSTGGLLRKAQVGLTPPKKKKLKGKKKSEELKN